MLKFTFTTKIGPGFVFTDAFMLSSTQQRKAKVTLSDYPYRRDIENRIVMSQLSVFEVNVLQEIIHHSLKLSVNQLAEDLECGIDSLIPVLDKLSATKLFKRNQMTLSVDKEMRKFFEFQLEKFTEDFVPDLEYLQNVLNHVPIHVLPVWYAIPRSSDNIFSSIVEKYFATPKIYLQYLSELQFEDRVLNSIVNDVYQAPDYTIRAADLLEKYELTRESLEEHLLLLEYHFACCLSYQRVKDRWEEIVTPFAELKDYLKFESQAKAHAISGTIEKKLDTDFSFIQDLTTVIKACQAKKVNPKEVKGLKAKTVPQIEKVIEKLIKVEFVKSSANGQILATAKGKEWITKNQAEKVVILATDPLNTLSNLDDFASLWNRRNLSMVEKKLRKYAMHEWIDLDRFTLGFVAPIADKEPVVLKKKGKKWRYEIPVYSDLEKKFVQAVVMERLAELGVVDTGTHKGKKVFSLSTFGTHFIH